jgi:hypothetical protein
MQNPNALHWIGILVGQASAFLALILDIRKRDRLKSLCGNLQKSISTSLLHFRFCRSDLTYALLQKIQAVEIEVATQALKPVLRSSCGV